MSKFNQTLTLPERLSQRPDATVNRPGGIAFSPSDLFSGQNSL